MAAAVSRQPTRSTVRPRRRASTGLREDSTAEAKANGIVVSPLRSAVKP